MTASCWLGSARCVCLASGTTRQRGPSSPPVLQVDALIIGGWYGIKGRSGVLGQYLLALSDGPVHGSTTRFISFVKCVLGF